MKMQDRTYRINIITRNRI